MTRNDWSPETYSRFRGFRLRPAIDLISQVPGLPAGDIVDLGCGDGAVGPALAARWPDRAVIGIDTSPAMRARAAETGGYTRVEAQDIALWEPAVPPALIFSNAALHWLPDHGELLPRLAFALAPGGTLAVQMPRQFDAPSHRLLREIAAAMFPDRFDLAAWQAPVWPAVAYHRLLAPLGVLNLWETDYVQRMSPPAEGGHPVRRFTESTAMRPYLDPLTADEARAFIARYEQALVEAYPVEPDGAVLFPFRRLFLILTAPDFAF